ncbi:MBL fold metallo-hydrolase [Azospirillum sp. INR13]|uniref:MBL fold metallo-hydrolase n=1 Tax=Azospirillum sp. INR13 TaxID=2596919 RepID=UPI002102FFB9|nr:MBL fold metallo-hydrolase [Azospirillum sp. INR13]
MSKNFASHADLEEKAVSFDRLSDNAYAYTAEGDPNTGIVIGDDAVMVIDTQATPVMAQDVIRRIREVTDKPIRHVVLSHYHAVRVLGASGYAPEQIIASEDTRDLIVERGEADMASEIGRFPRLFRAVESVPGLTWPTITFRGRMTMWLGSLEVQLLQLGRGHSKGDTVVWLPQQKIPVLRRPRRIRRHPLLRRRLFQPIGRPTLDAIAALKPEKAGARPRRRPDHAGTGGGGAARHPRLHQRTVRTGEAGRRRRQGSAGDLQGHLHRAEAEVRPLGDLRPLHALQRHPRL